MYLSRQAVLLTTGFSYTTRVFNTQWQNYRRDGSKECSVKAAEHRRGMGAARQPQTAMREEAVVTTLPQGLASVLGTQNSINVHIQHQQRIPANTTVQLPLHSQHP